LPSIEVEGRVPEGERLDERTAFAHREGECRGRVLCRHPWESVLQPSIEVGPEPRLVTQVHEQLAELIGAAATADAPRGLAPLVAGDQVLALRAQQAVVQRSVASKLVA